MSKYSMSARYISPMYTDIEYKTPKIYQSSNKYTKMCFTSSADHLDYVNERIAFFDQTFHKCPFLFFIFFYFFFLVILIFEKLIFLQLCSYGLFYPYYSEMVYKLMIVFRHISVALPTLKLRLKNNLEKIIHVLTCRNSRCR